MKIAVIGSREFKDIKLLFSVLDDLKVKLPELKKIDAIVSGGAVGADKLAEEYAKTNGYQTEIYLPDYPRYGRSAPLKRNIQIIEAADVVVAFWNGKSPGTRHSINEALKRKKMVLTINYAGGD
jgi:hypothetical protein